MKVVNTLIHYFIRSGWVLALSSSAMVAAYSILFNVPQNIFLLMIPFFLTFSAYHINRKAELHEDELTHSKRTEFIRKNQWLDILAVVFYLLALALALLRNIESFVLVLITPILVAIYTFRTFSRFKRLKEVTIGKNAIVALGWTVFVFLTATYHSLSFDMAVYSIAIFVFFRLFINTIVFDMRDEKADSLFGIPTIPVTIGKQKTTYFLLVMNALGAIFLAYAVFVGWLPFYAHALNLVTIYGYYFIMKANDERIDQESLCDVVVDGEYILWPFLLLLGQFLIG